MQNVPPHKTRRAEEVIAPQSPRPQIRYHRPAIPERIFQEPEYLDEVSAPQRADAEGILSPDEQAEAVNSASQ
ncbi:hypothetical protein PV516_19460 [Streptomyces scabiei]|uniref:hypothetical protein n=1 Tax=Streptomyces scabiei TaxID=1930 RepID=UPI0029BF4CBE|nr:hypothetical protein [Streptomyces scabiei]MDX3165968.1 hypothetical protein [Streptomyces scabiei]